MPNSLVEEIIACHECDHLHYYELIPVGAQASCHQCGKILYRHIPDSLNYSLALYYSALILFFIANFFPFLSLELAGRVIENNLFSSAWAMYEQGMAELGLLIFLTSILFPLIVIVGMLYLLTLARFGSSIPYIGPVYRIVKNILPWSLVGVFMLGVIIAIVKLQDLGNVILGPALIALTLLLIIFTAARTYFNPHDLWSLIGPSSSNIPIDVFVNNEILNCRTCGFLSVKQGDHQNCSRCNTHLHHRKNNSIETTWALLTTAMILLIPANLYPVMTIIRFGRSETNTILGGAISLIESGMWALALIVFVASIIVPITKLITLSYLLISVQKKSTWNPRERTFLYRVTEIIGSWSIVDVFLVGLLSALVSMGALLTIRPGIGVVFFAGAVISTMLAAHSFDPRLIWDNVKDI